MDNGFNSKAHIAEGGLYLSIGDLFISKIINMHINDSNIFICIIIYKIKFIPPLTKQNSEHATAQKNYFQYLQQRI